MSSRFSIAIAALTGLVVCAATGSMIGMLLPAMVASGCDHFDDYPYTPWLAVGLGALGAVAAGSFTARRMRAGSAIPASS